MFEMAIPPTTAKEYIQRQKKKPAQPYKVEAGSRHPYEIIDDLIPIHVHGRPCIYRENRDNLHTELSNVIPNITDSPNSLPTRKQFQS